MRLTLPKTSDLSVADATPRTTASVSSPWFILSPTLYCGLCTLMTCLLFLLVRISPTRHKCRRRCPILEALHLRKVTALLGAIQVALRPILDGSILLVSCSKMNGSIWLDSWSDSEAVFLGSLVILGGFVAMGQRVKNIIDV